MELLRQKECAKIITVYGHNDKQSEVIFATANTVSYNSIKLSNHANLSEITFQFICLTDVIMKF